MKSNEYWSGFDAALEAIESMYGKSNFQHDYNICDCVKAKFNRMDKKEIRKQSAFSSSAGVSNEEIEKRVDEELCDMIQNEPVRMVGLMLIQMTRQCVDSNASEMTLSQENDYKGTRYKVDVEISVKPVKM